MYTIETLDKNRKYVAAVCIMSVVITVLLLFTVVEQGKKAALKKDASTICSYVIEILHIYNDNRIIFKEIINDINSTVGFEDCYKKVKENNKEYENQYYNLLGELTTVEKKQEAKNLIYARDECSTLIEEAYRIVDDGRLSDAKDFVKTEAVRVHNSFGEIVGDLLDKQKKYMEDIK